MAEACKIRKHLSRSAQLQQMSIVFESGLSRSLPSSERQKVIKRLARLLLQAAGVLTEDSADER